MARIRTVFFGTAELACDSLRALAESNAVELQAVVTQPDRPKGRHLRLQASPVKEAANRLNLPVLQPPKALAAEFIESVNRLKPDMIVVAAYGQILPETILAIPRFGCLNVHASLLPKYRGAAPIQWAILDDQARTGITIMKMDAGLDTGEILTQEATPIDDSDTAVTLHDRLASLGAGLLIATLSDYVAGRVSPRKQAAAEATYARKIVREDGRLHWSQTARSLWNRVRGLVPWPGTFALIPSEPKPLLVKIHEATVASSAQGAPGEVLHADPRGILVACGSGTLRLLRLQREGARPVSAAEFLNGHPLKPGEVLR